MGNSSSKDSRGSNERHQLDAPLVSSPGISQSQSARERIEAFQQAAARSSARGGRHDLTFLSLTRDREVDPHAADKPRETKQERDARRAERERQARLKERERSVREEHVDGGFLVTLGVYTGAEDFSKPVVRQLQIERRLAPFWKGLNDHVDSWTEAQLVAAVRGLTIPAPDEIPAHMARTTSEQSGESASNNAQTVHLPIPSSTQSVAFQSDPRLSSSQPVTALHPAGPSSSSTSALFRGRAKTLASLAPGSKNQFSDMVQQEMQLPHDPNVNGLPIEAYLYREATECPICFMYYPPWLNKTRCCDQPICSECFVQIKRPDPHPPEHEQPGQQQTPDEEAETLVSEVAACPFCVTPEFGVSYEPPPFRRGLTYANHNSGSPLNALKDPSSAMSSSLSLNGTAGRRRATSLSANNSQVITTDRVRPDWAKKLADARAHALRRAAAATALHNAAYILGSPTDATTRAMAFGRRRRTVIVDSAGESGSGTPGGPEDGGAESTPGRGSSRRNRVDDLEELMMMEAIRLSLAAEEDRKRKEEKDQRKKDKKEAKEIRKEAKAAGKMAKKNSSAVAALYPARSNDSSSTWDTTSMARSTSNLGMRTDDQVEGKGKAPAQDFAGIMPLTEPTSTLNTEMRDQQNLGTSSPSSSKLAEDPQNHLAKSRAIIQGLNTPPTNDANRRPHIRHLSSASSIASSADSTPAGSVGIQSNIPSATGSGLDLTQTGATPAGESMFNFRSLAAMVGEEEKAAGDDQQHIEHSQPLSKAEKHDNIPNGDGVPGTCPVPNINGHSNDSASETSPTPHVNGANGETHTNNDDCITAGTTDSPPTVTVKGKELDAVNVVDTMSVPKHEST